MLVNAAARFTGGRAAPAAFRTSPRATSARQTASLSSFQRSNFASIHTEIKRSAQRPCLRQSISHIAFRSSNRSFASKPPTAPTSNPSGKPVPEEPTPFAKASPESEIPPRGFKSKLRQKSEEQRAEEEIEPSGSPTGPLPDLRYGIPSTFASEQSSFEKKPDSTEKEQDPLEYHLTEQPESASGGRRDDDGPREAYVSSIERRRNAIATYFYMLAAVGSVLGAVYFGRNWSNETETNSHPDAPNGYTPTAIYNRSMERLSMLFEPYTEPAFQKLLPDPPADPNFRAPYTLVMSLEDLLVCSKWDRSNGYTIAKRPGVDYFIKYMSQYYELVVFTTVQQMNADQVLRKLDPFRFCLPLTREATRYMDGEHVKDLSYLNRDLSKTIIIDTVPAHVKLQPENAIILPKWKGDGKDPNRADLVALIPFLEYIASMAIGDVRAVLKSYEGTHIPTEFAKREAKAREEFNKRLAEEKSKRGRLGGGSWLGGLSSSMGFKPVQQMAIPGEQSPLEGLAEGKMFTDQMRERGQRAYQERDKELRENGEMWLKQQEEDEKKMQDEAAKSMMTSWLPFFGAVGDKQQPDPGPKSEGDRK